MKKMVEKMLLFLACSLAFYGFVALVIANTENATVYFSAATLSLVGACYLKIK